MPRVSAFTFGWDQFFDGAGVVPIDSGNLLNVPGDPPVQTGSYQFVAPWAFQGQGHNATDIHSVPPEYRDWSQYPLNVADPSGQTGGGYAAPGMPVLPSEADLYFDASSGLYYDLGATS